MSTKNPFELRADLLKQAQDLLESQYDAQVDFATKAFFALAKEGTATMENFKQYAPKFPTPEDVLKQAKEFYAFVSNTK